MAFPSVGERGFRVLDGLRFACKVVAVATDHQTLSVRFLDADAAVEDNVELDEFEPEVSASDDAAKPPPHVDRFLLPIQSRTNSALCILGTVARFVDPFERLASFARVCRPWRHALLKSSLWRSLRVRSRVSRLSRLLDVQITLGEGDSAALRVRDVLETMVLDDSEVTDDQVVSIAMKCSKLQSISLRRCQHVSFMVVYELLRLSRERHSAAGTHLKSLDLWLCRGVSPTFVSQLTAPAKRQNPQNDETQRRHRLDIREPGFFFVEISEDVLDALRERTTGIPRCPRTASNIDILWISETVLIEMIESQQDPIWKALQRHTPVLKASALSGFVPLVPFDRYLTQKSTLMYLGIPASPVEDLTRLISEWEPHMAVQTQLQLALRELATKDSSMNQSNTEPHDAIEKDPLAAQAERVFAMLRQTTEQLQSQVDRLENQVAVMTEAKLAAEREYRHAERELQRIAQKADRAVLHLATSSDPTSFSSATGTPSGIEQPPQNGVITDRPGDSLLPPLPTTATIASLAKSLERQWFAVLDGFVGEELSTRVRQDVEQMYRTSRAVEDQLPSIPDSTHNSTNPPPAPAQARFTLGELAGGNTGRNLRYQMAHVRGDYMLWLDETDAFCPPSVRLMLRQLDRLILERLSVDNHELSMSVLLRKKAMVTCYPGDQNARYTRHCDNPNRNGRKLTAILYLNADWDPVLHGGELLVHRDGAQGTRVAPLLDRLLLFFSDTRVPHEVLRCKDATRDRFALTVWYLDYDEYMHAQVFGTTKEDGDAVERRRIEKEMERFQGSGG